MEFLLLGLFLISVPIFYVYGIISYFQKRNKSTEQENDIFEDKEKREQKPYYLKQLIDALAARISKDPSIKASVVLKEFEHELSLLENPHKESFNDRLTLQEREAHDKEKSVPSKDVSSIWESWYSENSINLLLYVGAFLIVASASIFVGLSWQTVSGSFKAGFLTLITLGFFGSGIWFYYLPKIRNAGVTFTAIAALLIPFCGVAWYNFVLKDYGVTFGSVWLVTSALMITIYTSLILWQKHLFYGYASSFSIVSLLLSLVNVYGLNNEYYVLNSIISAYVMFATRFLLQKSNKKELEKFAHTIEISENIVLPVSIFFGFSMAMSENKLFSMEASLSAFLVTIYYFFSYLFNQKNIYLVLSAVLFPITISLFYKWMNFPGIYLAFTLDLIAIFYLVFGYLFKNYERLEEVNINVVLANSLTILVFLICAFSGFESWQLITLALVPIVISLVSNYLIKKPLILFTATIFAGIASYILMTDVFKLTSNAHFISIGFVLISCVLSVLSIIFKKEKEYFVVFGVSTICYEIIALLFASNSQIYLLGESLLFALLMFVGSILFERKELIYGANGLMFFALWMGVLYFKVPVEYYPLLFLGLELSIYGVSLFAAEDYKKVFKQPGLATLMISPFWFGINSKSYYSGVDSPYKMMEINSLISLYASAAVFGYEAYKSVSIQIGYFASALGLIAVLWQINLLGYQNIQFYSIPLAVYFIGIAYTRKLLGDEEKRNLFDVVGLTILMLPTVFQAFSEDGARYALMLGLEGVLLLFSGISAQYKFYRYAAILAIVLAVFSQSYSYLFALPRWIITGAAGLIFLIVAILLLFKRKDPE